MSKKRNVDVENHLLTGGLITGFLTFMGFGSGAAVATIVTGAMVVKDITKDSKEEAFRQDIEDYQEIRKKIDEHWREVEKLIEEFKFFYPDSPSYLEQLELEALFKNGEIIDFCDKEIKYKSVRLNVLTNEAKKAEDNNKILVLENGKPWEYIVKIQNGYIGCYKRGKYPFQFKEKCMEAGIPFKVYGYAELYELKKNKMYQFYEPYRLEFMKYQS